MQAHYRTLQSIRQSIFVVQATAQGYPVTFVNEAFTELTGYSSDEVTGRSCDLLLDDGDTAHGLLAAALHDRAPAPNGRLQFRLANASALYDLLSVSAICDNEHWYYVALIDRSGRNEGPGQERVAAALGESSAPSDSAETGMVTNEFVARVVHELRSPLSACLAWVSLLELRAAESPETKQAVEVIRRNLDRQAQLINELADALQPSAGETEIYSNK